MEKEPELIDITGYTFEQFVAFVFDHEFPDEASRKDPWYFCTKLEVEYDAIEVCEHYIRLFRAPEFLRAKYSVVQLDEGFWAIIGAAFDCSVERLLDDKDVPYQLKKECVQAMFDLFQRLFMFEPLESADFMWWDAISIGWMAGIRKPENGGEDLLLQNAIFETLSRILALPSEHCQKAALHGLGHLHHPKTAALIATYLRDNPALDDETRNYAEAASRFQIL